MRGPPGPETHQLPAGLQREVVSKQRRPLRSADVHVAERQERVKGSRSQLGGYRFERLDGEHGDGGIHVRGFAEEPVADDSLVGYESRLLGICGGDIRGAHTVAELNGPAWPWRK
jgi:hypothetical protein